MEVLGFIGGLCTSVSVIPQIIHMVHHKSAKDFSWYMLGLSSLGQLFWISHGGIHRDPAVLTFASLNLLVNATFTIIKVSTSEELQQSPNWFVRCVTLKCLKPPSHLPLHTMA